jgi:AcrR family transcriptional regulator
MTTMQTLFAMRCVTRVIRMDGRRARLRASLSAEIRSAALSELRRVGPAALSLREVAKVAGISPSGLYRYVDGRDGLLEMLIADGFETYGNAIADAIPATAADLGSQLNALAREYRQWAHSNPEQFALILGSPIPGFRAEPAGPTISAVQHFAKPMIAIYVGSQAGRRASRSDIDLTSFDPTFGKMSRGLLNLILRAWARVHGLVSLELFGHLGWSGSDVATLLEAEVASILFELAAADS